MKWLVLLIATAAVAQQPKVVRLDAPPDAYLFPAEDKVKLRDLQYQGDQIEIENQKLLLQLERNKQKQNELLDQMKAIAFEFAQKRGIDLTQYELEPVQMKFAKKKK